MDLVDKEDVTGTQGGQDRCQITLSLDHWTTRLMEGHAEFICEDGRKRCLPEARRAGEQHVIERLTASGGRSKKDPEFLPDRVLPSECVQ